VTVTVEGVGIDDGGVGYQGALVAARGDALPAVGADPACPSLVDVWFWVRLVGSLVWSIGVSA
jgi:hypothetical protein